VTDIARPRRPWDRTPVEAREYFELLGAGLVSVAPGRAPGAAGAGGWQPPSGGAWVHVGADGRARAFSGKAEVGQGTRSALTLVVAEELRLPAERVELVMGDTDLCPWDMGTFGSRSMPDAAPSLAAAAAGARMKLTDLGAERWGAAPADLEAVDGEVRRVGSASRLTYAELVRGGRTLVVTPPDVPRSPASSWTRAGRPLVDPGAEEVVTGRRRYVSDLVRPGLLHGAILWPPTYGARLGDAPEMSGPSPNGATIVRVGNFVGAVAGAASDARDALRDLAGGWTGFPQPGEREIEGYLRSHPAEGDHWDTDEELVGDVDRALTTADLTVDATYRSAYIAHVPLEPHCAVAEWEGSRLTVWLGTQTPFRIRTEVAGAVGVPEEDVRIVVPPTGSGFGGKHGGEVATAAAHLARAASRPVRVAFTREEEFRHGYFRPMSIVDVRAGATRDGKLTAWSFLNVNGGAAALLPPYRIPNRKVGNALSRSPLPQGSLRALAANPNNFARESAIDELARGVGIDPADFREKNLDDERLVRVMRVAATRAGWSARTPSPGRGWGLAVGREKGGRVATVAEVTVSPDRRVLVHRLVTAFEAGAIVNPDNLRNQVEGAQVMALGEALFEAIRFEGGSVLNPRLSQYRVPRFSDVPRIEVELVDAKELPPSGAGESPMIAVAPAVANAIFDATGTRLRSLPLVPNGRIPTAPTAGPPSP
jgi:nicotinate dehydrogenase subunit B